MMEGNLSKDLMIHDLEVVTVAVGILKARAKKRFNDYIEDGTKGEVYAQVGQHCKDIIDECAKIELCLEEIKVENG